MSHEPNLTADPPIGAPSDPPEGAPEPEFVARARRILSGGVRPGDYLPVPPEVRADVAAELHRLATEEGIVAAPEAERELLNAWTLQHHHGRRMVLARRTDRGVLVLAAGEEQVGAVYRALRPDYRSGFANEVPVEA